MAVTVPDSRMTTATNAHADTHAPMPAGFALRDEQRLCEEQHHPARKQRACRWTSGDTGPAAIRAEYVRENPTPTTITIAIDMVLKNTWSQRPVCTSGGVIDPLWWTQCF